MPSTLLIWNIQNFTSNKILPGLGAVPVFDIQGRQVKLIDKNQFRLHYIISATNPDIIVVIETISGQGVKGSLITGAGSVGALALLEAIRQAQGNQNWMLVPPLKLVDSLQVQEMEDDDTGELNSELLKEGAYTEGISVYFNSSKLSFLGPYVWPDSARVPQTYPNGDPRKVAVAQAAFTQGYPPPWNDTLPPGNHRAGQYGYFENIQNQWRELLFPGLGSRRPFFTKFQEAGTNRIISLVSLHFPPNAPAAGQALAALTRYFGLIYQIAQNEVILLAGDYNIDYLVQEGPEYDRLGSIRMDGFEPLLTHETVSTSTIYRTVQAHATATNYLGNKGLDNVAVRYGSQQARHPRNLAILNRVIDSPDFKALMLTPLPEILKLKEPEQTQCFLFPQNYGFLGPIKNTGTSDHLAIALQF